MQVTCPKCSETGEFPDKCAGLQAKCNRCKMLFTIPMQTKKCSFCSEEILAAAIKCKHCGEFLDGRNREAAQESVNPKPPHREGITPTPSSSPQRVITTEDNFLTRNRGCGDILIYGPLLFLFLLVVISSC